jgi:hypothetical protein
MPPLRIGATSAPSHVAPSTLAPRRDALERLAHLVVRRRVQRDAADVALVQDLRRDDLDDDG